VTGRSNGSLFRCAAAVAVLARATACALNPAAPGAAAPATTDLSVEAGFCVDEINRLRATVGLAPLARSAEIETFSTEAARIDGEMHQPHKHFFDTNGGHGVSHAENEIPWWTLAQWGSVHAVVRAGIAKEWTEGPGGGHYENMTGQYSSLACGISVRNGEVTVTQDFR
jgi:hypothetical protein